MFKWICFAAGLIVSLIALILLYQIKVDVAQKLESAKLTIDKSNQTLTTVNQKLPEIVAEIKKGTAALSDLAEDVELIKSVAGIDNDEPSRGIRSLAVYANEIQKRLASGTEGKDAIIMIEEIIGSDLKRVESVEEFLVGLNREMVSIILPLAKSKQEILYRATHSGPPRRKPFYLKFGDDEPVPLQEWIEKNHPESADLPNFKDDSK